MLGVSGFGFRVSGSGFGVSGFGFRVSVPNCFALGISFRSSSGFVVWGLVPGVVGGLGGWLCSMVDVMYCAKVMNEKPRDCRVLRRLR